MDHDVLERRIRGLSEDFLLVRQGQIKFKPSEALRGDIHSFWFLEEAREVFNHKTILPDSFRELIITLGEPMWFDAGDGALVELPRVYLGPLQKRPHRYVVHGSCQILAISIFPWAAPTLLDDHARFGLGHHVALDTAWQSFGEYLGGVAASRGSMQAVAELQQFVEDRWQPLPAGLAALHDIGQLIRTRRGDVSLAELSARGVLSVSRLERLFKQISSVPPKTYARLVRFESVRNSLVVNPDSSLAELSYTFGYTDQAHLTHEFKAFAAQSPGAFARGVRANIEAWQPADILQYV